jgi:3-deoxy-D-manno-octulosonate 8-phosphate phosphatase (KDO 8-P phosphatase)
MKFICLDIDGVLLPRNSVFLTQNPALSPFHPLDLNALQLAVQHKIPILILSGGNSQSAQFFLQEIGIQSIRLLCYNKFQALEDELLGFPELTLADVLYVGDSLNDLECMQNVGFPACPADADVAVLQAAKFKSKHKGGQGAVADALHWALGSVF